MEVWAEENISMKAVKKIREFGYQSYFINKEGEISRVKGNLARVVKEKGLEFDNFIFKKK